MIILLHDYMVNVNPFGPQMAFPRVSEEVSTTGDSSARARSAELRSKFGINDWPVMCRFLVAGMTRLTPR
jgi:hypothetical protein